MTINVRVQGYNNRMETEKDRISELVSYFSQVSMIMITSRQLYLRGFMFDTPKASQVKCTGHFEGNTK